MAHRLISSNAANAGVSIGVAFLLAMGCGSEPGLRTGETIGAAGQADAGVGASGGMGATDADRNGGGGASGSDADRIATGTDASTDASAEASVQEPAAEASVLPALPSPLVELTGATDAGADSGLASGPPSVESCPMPSADWSLSVSRCLVEASEPACGAYGVCGLRFAEYVSVSFPGAIASSEWQGLPRGCVAIHQPGEVDATCPDDARIASTILARHSSPLTSEATLPGCRRADGTCGVWMETLGLGCVDSRLATAAVICTPGGECLSEGICSYSATTPCCAGTRCMFSAGLPHCL